MNMGRYPADRRSMPTAGIADCDPRCLVALSATRSCRRRVGTFRAYDGVDFRTIFIQPCDFSGIGPAKQYDIQLL